MKPRSRAINIASWALVLAGALASDHSEASPYCLTRMIDVLHFHDLGGHSAKPLDLKDRWTLLARAAVQDRGVMTTLHELGLVDISSLKRLDSKEAIRRKSTAHDAAIIEDPEYQVSHQVRALALASGKSVKIEVMDRHSALIEIDGRFYEAFWHSEVPAARAFFRIGEVERHYHPAWEALKRQGVQERHLDYLTELCATGLFKSEPVTQVSDSAAYRASPGSSNYFGTDSSLRPRIRLTMKKGQVIVFIDSVAYQLSLNERLLPGEMPFEDAFQYPGRLDWKRGELLWLDPLDPKQRPKVILKSPEPPDASTRQLVVETTAPDKPVTERQLREINAAPGVQRHIDDARDELEDYLAPPRR